MKSPICALMLFSIALTAAAQTRVTPPPKPGSNASSAANAEIIKLLKAGMPESVVLNKIHTSPSSFDTSSDALISLKKAGATDAELKAIVDQSTQPSGQPVDSESAATNVSLPQTLKFIKEKIAESSRFSYQIIKSNPVDGSTSPVAMDYWIGELVADTDNCSISGNLSHMTNLAPDSPFKISLKTVKTIKVEPVEQYMTRVWANPFFFTQPYNIASASSPAVTQVGVFYTGINEQNGGKPYPALTAFLFEDASMADRVAKALTHAVELCGGGEKNEPF